MSVTRTRSRQQPLSSAPTRPVDPVPGSPAAELATRKGLRMRPYRPVRALVGGLIVVAAVVAALTIYVRLDDTIEVLALNRTVLAGEQITGGDLRVESVDADTSFPHIRAADREQVVGRYAKYRLRAGSMIDADAIQHDPLVTEGRGLMSVAVPIAEVPLGLRERSHVLLFVYPSPVGGEQPPPVVVDAVIASLPRDFVNLVGVADNPNGTMPLAVEVPRQYGGIVGGASSISLMVIDDPVSSEVDPPVPDQEVVSTTGVTGPAATGTNPAPATPRTTLPASMEAATEGSEG